MRLPTMIRRPRSDVERPRGRKLSMRLIAAIAVALISLVTFYTRTEENPVTGEKQRVAGISPEDDVKMGLAAAPELIAQFGGEHPDPRAQALVDRVGARLLEGNGLLSEKVPFKFEFHLLNDPQTINAFALPGGQVFITVALLEKLPSEGALAGVLGHEIGHVVERHGAEHMARAQLMQGLTGAAVIATYDPNNPSSRNTPAMAAMIGQLITLRYGREDELESDRWGVRMTVSARYDPRSMVEVMKVLKAASGGRGGPEWTSSHPDPDNRIDRIEQAIREEFPDGLPAGLEP
jgi:beta-barrel assembly-enhancing protease